VASILCVTDGFLGMLYSSIELARRLATAGHRVTFASVADSRGLAQHHGLKFLPLDPSRYESFLETDAASGVLRRLIDLRDRRARAAESTAAEVFAWTVRDLRPELLLIDGEMHEHIIAASSTGVPIALLNTFVSIWRRPGLPPPHHLAQPGVGWKGTRIGTSLLWLALRLWKLQRATSLKIRRIGCDRLSVLRLLARRAGFDFRQETESGQWLMPLTYRRLPVLSLHALEFEFPHQPRDGVHYVGPMVLEDRIDRPLNQDDETRLETILSRHRRERSDRKLIYAAFGSVFSTDLGLLQRLIAAVAQRPDWELVISLSDRIAPVDMGGVPENVHPFAWLPQLRVLRQVDVAVTHGGINTIDECVLEGVPMLVYCGFETDMAGNTSRVEHHGIGIAGDRGKDSTPIIRSHIERLLREPGFAGNLKRLGDSYAAYADNHVLERVVESLFTRQSRINAATQRGEDS
jgi:UDP:flavonoid glycosyltransferase YjiC (YdhE family)